MVAQDQKQTSLTDFDTFDPVQLFRSKLEILQQQRKNDAKPTILTRLIDSINPHDPKCEHLIDEAQIAIRRVAHVHDKRCYLDPSVHEVDSRETGYALPVYEIHAVPQPCNWVETIRILKKRQTHDDRLGFVDVQTRDKWLEDEGDAKTMSDDPQIESDAMFVLPGRDLPTAETQQFELRMPSDERLFNNDRFAKWIGLPSHIRGRRLVDWLKANYEGSTHTFYFDVVQVTTGHPHYYISFVVINTKQVTCTSKRLNEIFNYLDGWRTISADGLQVSDYNRHGTALPGLEPDEHWVRLGGFNRKYAVCSRRLTDNGRLDGPRQYFYHHSFLRAHSDPDVVFDREYTAGIGEKPLADTDIRAFLDSDRYEGRLRAKSRTPERRILLLLFMRELCIVVHHWAGVRTAADEVMDCFANDLDEERRTRNVKAFVREYTKNEYVDYVNTVKKVTIHTWQF
ncbi:hypothetical protein BJ508DRAFT_323695 [Ascobolus immersus RN42]|uniref:Uncharacterized protein n=1 Tax=Ascobolus immersus RN42 TaxID=1160509 RepID=A0A3N4IE53_ASCIM|nr:hypothetical protein BJ508DRAFT_323695 [Ascobolus immersus RN42]